MSNNELPNEGGADEFTIRRLQRELKEVATRLNRAMDGDYIPRPGDKDALQAAIRVYDEAYERGDLDARERAANEIYRLTGRNRRGADIIAGAASRIALHKKAEQAPTRDRKKSSGKPREKGGLRLLK